MLICDKKTGKNFQEKIPVLRMKKQCCTFIQHENCMEYLERGNWFVIGLFYITSLVHNQSFLIIISLLLSEKVVCVCAKIACERAFKRKVFICIASFLY